MSWVSIAILIAVLYPLSIGPACWICMRLDSLKHQHLLRVIGLSYKPVVWGLIDGPRPLKDAADWYIDLGAPAGVTVNRGDYTGVRWDGPGYNYTFLGR